MDSKIVNSDATGNRVAGMIFGPKKVIIVVGINRIAKDLDKALERLKKIAASLNAKRIRDERGWERLPCVESSQCADCNAENRICNVTTVIEKKTRTLDMLMAIIVGKNSDCDQSALASFNFQKRLGDIPRFNCAAILMINWCSCWS